MSPEASTKADRRIDRLLAEYGESHRHPVNKAIHWCAVPVISWSVLAMMWSAPFPEAVQVAPFVNWATVFALLAIVYYIGLSLPLAVGMAMFASICFWLIIAFEANAAEFAGKMPVWRFAAALFAIAWAFQFIGHAIEGKRPSFFKDFQFLLIGPAWLMHFILRRLGVAY
jgi:uncharacterized membrane protein YGL010W